jgi:hypothetical protein
MTRLALVLLLVALAGCAHKRTAPPTAAIPPAAETPAPGATQPPPTPPPGSQPISAPWDTAGSAAARAARRNHVYPKGTNALGQKLVDSLPDPAKLVQGGVSEETPAKTTPPPKPQPTPGNDSQCWEVQVLVTTNAEKARQEVRNIDRALDIAAWVRENGGMYRVRVGGCLTADGATELANRLKEQGYPEAFRVMREP